MTSQTFQLDLGEKAVLGERGGCIKRLNGREQVMMLPRMCCLNCYVSSGGGGGVLKLERVEHYWSRDLNEHCASVDVVRRRRRQMALTFVT